MSHPTGGLVAELASGHLICDRFHYIAQGHPEFTVKSRLALHLGFPGIRIPYASILDLGHHIPQEGFVFLFYFSCDAGGQAPGPCTLWESALSY